MTLTVFLVTRILSLGTVQTCTVPTQSLSRGSATTQHLQNAEESDFQNHWHRARIYTWLFCSCSDDNWTQSPAMLKPVLAVPHAVQNLNFKRLSGSRLVQKGGHAY